MSVEVHGEHRPGPVGDRRLDQIGVHDAQDRIGVDKNRSGSARLDRPHCRIEGVGRGDDFVSGADVERSQNELEGGEPGVHADGVGSAAVRGELSFEARGGGAEDEVAPLQDGA